MSARAADDGFDPIDSLRDLPAATAPPLGAALEAELRDLAPTPPRRPARQALIAVAASLVYGAVVLAVYTVRHELGDLPRVWLIAYLAAWMIGFALPLWISIVPRPGSMMPRWQLGGALAALSSVGFVLAGFLVPRSAPGSSHLGLGHGHACLSMGLIAAVMPVVLGTLILRGAAPVGSRATAAALGAAGGSLGGLVLHLHCPISDGLHVGVTHGGVVALAALLSAALVPRVLRPT
jgi:hypothetical protein